ncbi:serine/threonine-protein kinase [Planctomicrobium sp. SH661]|uniref:serine/threonine-protein kinase n=1 Tax=Planctomicrobium sp. SH661 TaxID=3448124 RepID=UPI003F5C3379
MTEPSSDTTSGTAHPTSVGPYTILKELGSGGMGTVYLAEHKDSGRKVAIKILPASLSREPGFVARFGREIAAMQQLHSGNIVELFESGEDNGIYYYAMEYVEGETLTARLKREKKLPWREAIDIAVQVCKALKSAHNSGIVHRDLKPSNLLIDDTDHVKLTDFGIAQVFATSKLTVTGGILGTAEYMSPEQAQGSRATRQSDIYSLGAVLYVMLTGRPPFTGKTTLEIIQKHRFAQFDSPKRIVPEIPFWLDEIVCKCLSKKPEDRYPDAYVLMLRLQEVPKKVDLKESQESDRLSADHDHETIAETRSQDQHVGGTLVRDLFRAQMDSQAESTMLGRLFDNVWVLAALLILLVVGGFLLSRWNSVTPEEMFARGEKLMQEPEGASWEIARVQYFDPLLEKDEATWRPKIEPYLPALQLYDLKKQFLSRFRKKEPPPQSEPEAILRQAIELRKEGRVGEARAKLLALENLTTGNDELQSIREIAAQLREDLAQYTPTTRLKFVREAMSRADRLQAQGQIGGALAVWRSVVELYDADPDADVLVAQARQRIAEALQPASETSSTQEGESATSPLP